MPLFRKKKRTTSIRVRKREVPDGLWIKCPSCKEMIFKSEVDALVGVCPRCEHHFEIGRRTRLRLLTEEGSFEEWDASLSSVDALGFAGKVSYKSKLASHVRKTGERDAITCGRARMGHRTVALGIMDFSFLGASMGAVVGEKVTRLIERGTEQKLPVIICCASGGARMYEGMFSLMQMAKTSGALARHADAGLLYVPILTHPTMAGVMASFATLGDVIMAEPGALIGFAGSRVIRETTQQVLPEGFQRAEFLEKHGLVDMVVRRKDLKKTLIQLLDLLAPQQIDPEA